MASTPQDAISERQQWAATLYALANLVEAGEIEVGGDMATVYHLNDGASVLDGSVSLEDAEVDAEIEEFPAFSLVMLALADRLMDTAYGDDGWSDGDEGVEERGELLDFVLDAKVPEIMDAIRIASLEDGLAAA